LLLIIDRATPVPTLLSSIYTIDNIDQISILA
jgi:hypothetical protein